MPALQKTSQVWPVVHRAAMLCCSLAAVTSVASGADRINFDVQVAPILTEHCIACHSGEKPKGGLSLTQAESAVKGGESGIVLVSGDSSKSLLWKRVHDDEMPPKHPLNAAQKTILKTWNDEGTRWGTSPIDPFSVTTSSRAGRDWWSLQPPRKSDPPPVAGAVDDRSGNSIDAFVLAKLQQSGFSLSDEATPRVLVRRLYFDLIGLPPAPEKVAEFVTTAADSGSWEKLIDELLASEHYGERWGRHWLDVVRFGESDGFERNFPRRNAWHYRDWVIQALNKDLPYTEFVRMQLIGDLLKGGPEGAAATGFWVAGVHNTVVGGSRRMKLLARQDEIEEVLATVGQTFVGLTVNCARCHDHKFDPITQKEFYQLASSISGLGYGERTVKSQIDTEKLTRIGKQLKTLQSQLTAIDTQARKEILVAREKGQVRIPDPPVAFARWEFDHDLQDSVGELHGKAVGNVRIENGALVIGGEAFVETVPLKKEITEKTLEAWVLLDHLEQRGGGAIAIGTRNGVVFDAIVFGEREPKRWMAGSNGFVRTDSFRAPEEKEATKRPVHFVIVYAKDGTITGYRDGIPYGSPIRKSGLQNYKAGESEIVFGLRHKPVGSNKHLQARIQKAAFYDRALSPEEVAASSGNAAGYVPEKQLVEWLADDKRKQRTQLKLQIAAASKARDEINAKASRKIYTLTPGGGVKTNVLLRGDPENPGETVSPGAVASVAGINSDFGLAPDAPESDRRRKLAAWITDRNNPLFARVVVNRVWHYHFGTGLVDTPNDFGFNGGRPSHPELLDWLTVWFQENGYSLKKLHRMILSSRTWRQSGYVKLPVRKDSNRKNPLNSDADNR